MALWIFAGIVAIVLGIMAIICRKFLARVAASMNEPFFPWAATDFAIRINEIGSIVSGIILILLGVHLIIKGPI